MFPSWDGNVSHGNDIALIKLTKKANVTAFPTLDVPGNTHRAKDIVAAIGWGIEGTTTRRLQTKLQMADSLRYVEWKKCMSDGWWPGLIKPSMCCAYSPRQDTCQGQISLTKST